MISLADCDESMAVYSASTSIWGLGFENSRDGNVGNATSDFLKVLLVFFCFTYFRGGEASGIGHTAYTHSRIELFAEGGEGEGGSLGLDHPSSSHGSLTSARIKRPVVITLLRTYPPFGGRIAGEFNILVGDARSKEKRQDSWSRHGEDGTL